MVGAIFSWLYPQTNSPWRPVLAHSSLNATAGLSLLRLLDVDMSVGGTIARVIAGIPLAAFVG